MEKDKQDRKKVQRLVACPRCRKSSIYSTQNPHRPFCSAACKNQDVVDWADGNYRIPGPPAHPTEPLQEDEEEQT